jgi:hypothetical protein
MPFVTSLAVLISSNAPVQISEKPTAGARPGLDGIIVPPQ